MIDWDVLSNLHAIKKLEKIISKWYGLDCMYVDNHYKIQSGHNKPEFEFNSHLLKVQIEMDYGYEILGQDLEKVTDNLDSSKERSLIFDSFFKSVRGVAAKISVGGELMGTVVAYPFFDEKFTSKEEADVIKKLTESGAKEVDAKAAINNIKKLSDSEINNLQELIELVAEEVTDFQEARNQRDELIHSMSSELTERFLYHNLIGKSKQMQKVYNLLEKIKTSESSVFVQGENGTGKELVAKAIHYNSPRKDKLFLAVNCSAFNDNLLDSELFGHVKGAFTGAIKDKKGVFETADGGTLFLDEIGDTSLSMQVKLLRVLQEGTLIPVGGVSPIKVNVRIVCATNKNIKEMMLTQAFREDLFYRINVINVALPPLRERVGDIDILMEHFLKKRCDEGGIPLKAFSKRTKEKMHDYNWPGNVRELENEVERLMVLSGEENTIQPDGLSPRILDFGAKPAISSHGINTGGKLKPALEELEAIMIKEGLKRCNFNKSKLSKELGVSRASLIMKVEKYGLDKRKLNAA
jgi:two-component system response regulator HupR/HoxA